MRKRNHLYSQANVSKCSLNPCLGTSHYRSVETDFLLFISFFSCLSECSLHERDGKLRFDFLFLLAAVELYGSPANAYE